MKIIIIGGNAAGLTAAAKLRRLDEKTIITVYEKGIDISYSGCGMPYYLGEVIDDEDQLIARNKETFDKQDIDILLNHEVIKLDSHKKQLQIKNHENGEMITDTYDQLLISTGTIPKRTHIKGSDEVEVHVLNKLKDMRKLDAVLDKAKTIAIIGGGYIGVEVAENLVKLNKKVHIIEREDQLLLVYDKEVTDKAKKELERLGVDVHLNENLEKYRKEDQQTYVKTDKNEYKVDIIIEVIGVAPHTKFLEDSGIKMKKGAIITNDQMQTSIKDIYAAGDCVLYYHLIKNDLSYVPLGTHANKTGKIVALNMMGIKTSFPGIVGSNVLKVGDLAFGKTGIGIDEAKKLNLDYDFVDITANHQTGYYPGAKKLFVRLVYEKSTSILKGAQLVGKKGVGDRINIMALAITKKLTAKEFAALDFAYAPPFSPVWDPLLIAASQIK